MRIYILISVLFALSIGTGLAVNAPFHLVPFSLCWRSCPPHLLDRMERVIDEHV
jgi:hypothetical protein